MMMLSCRRLKERFVPRLLVCDYIALCVGPLRLSFVTTASLFHMQNTELVTIIVLSISVCWHNNPKGYECIYQKFQTCESVRFAGDKHSQ